MRTLILQRHAKSDYPPGVPDHQRPLAERGRRDAPAAGRWLAEHAPHPDLALVSTAVRARETWALIEKSCAARDVRWDDRIYEASVAGLLRVISEVGDEVKSLVVVGHNPGLESLAGFLVVRGDADLRRQMGTKFPTSAIAVITSDGTWGQFPNGELADFAVPRG